VYGALYEMSPDPATLNRRRAALDRETVARAALDVLDREGLDGLSMRRLAADLGVGTMTLYGYFRDKRELLDAVVDIAVEDFVPPPPVEGLRPAVVAYLEAVRAWLGRHPTLVALRGQETIVRPAAFAVSEHGMRLLLDAGFPPAEAARAFRLLFVHVFGSSAFAPRAPDADGRRRIEAALLTLPEDEFPAMRTAAVGAADALGGDEQFRYGLDRILDGLEARLRELAG
jgi:AcrR family transcriptional regulator